MEENSSLGIKIRNVPVRLNEGNVDTDGPSIKPFYVSPSDSDSQIQVSHFNESFETNRSSNTLDLADKLKENLIVGQKTDDCGLINGCNKFVHKDLNCVHISVNGINKCNNYELLNAHLDEISHACTDHSFNNDEMERTESIISNREKSLKSDEKFLSSEDADSSKALLPISESKNIESSFSLPDCDGEVDIAYLGYGSESQMPDIMRLIQKDLSEPYSIYTYRYFIHNWPKLCFLALHEDQCVGAIVCKLDVHKKHSRRGYIAMLAVDEKYRKKKIGSNLVLKAIDAMVEDNADEVVLETEITNKPALKLYENLGFVRDKRLFRYYLNGVDALRLKLWLR